MARNFIMSVDWVGIPGNIEVWIEYHAANLRILEVRWDNQCGRDVRALIWNNDVLFYDFTHGQGTGSESVPGNHRLVEVTEPEVGTHLQLPDGITYRFEMV